MAITMTVDIALHSSLRLIPITSIQTQTTKRHTILLLFIKRHCTFNTELYRNQERP